MIPIITFITRFVTSQKLNNYNFLVGSLLTAIALPLLVTSTNPAQAQAATCSMTFNNLSTQVEVGKEFPISISFRECARGTFGSIRLRNTSTNSVKVLGSVLMLNGQDNLEFLAKITTAGTYVLEGTNSETPIPFVVNRSPVITVGTPATAQPPSNTPPTNEQNTSNNLQNTPNLPGNEQANTTTPAIDQTTNNQNNLENSFTTGLQTSTNLTANTSGPTEGLVVPLTSFSSLGEFIVSLIRLALTAIGGLAILFIIIGAVRMVASAGNEAAVKAGKATVTWAVIGLIVALLSFSFIAGLQALLGRTG